MHNGYLQNIPFKHKKKYSILRNPRKLLKNRSPSRTHNESLQIHKSRLTSCILSDYNAINVKLTANKSEDSTKVQVD